MRFYAWATIVALLWLTMMERAVHALFVVSLAALGISPTLLAIPLLFSAFIYALGLQRWWPHSRRFLMATTSIAIAAILTTIIAPGSWTVIASAIAVLALTVLLFDAIARLGAKMLGPCVIAALLAITLRIVSHTAPIGMTEHGIVLLVALAAVAAILGWSANRTERPHAGSAGAAPIVIAFLLLEYQLLGVPSAIATLHTQNMMGEAWWYFTLVLGAQLGLLAGLHLTGRRITDMSILLIAAACFTAGAFIVTGVAYSVAPVWLFIAQVGAVTLLRSALEHDNASIKAAGARAGLLQLTWWLIVVLHAFATKWPFLPSFTWPVLHGRATLYLVATLALFPVAVLLGRRRA